MSLPSSAATRASIDRKSTRLNSSLMSISYAVFCLKKKTCCSLLSHRQIFLAATLRVHCQYGPCSRGGSAWQPQLARPQRVRRSFFVNDTATPEIYTLSLHDALPIFRRAAVGQLPGRAHPDHRQPGDHHAADPRSEEHTSELQSHVNLVCRLLLE